MRYLKAAIQKQIQAGAQLYFCIVTQAYLADNPACIHDKGRREKNRLVNITSYEAINAYSRAAELNPLDFEAWMACAQVLFRKKRVGEAIIC